MAEWAAIRAAVLARAGWACAACGFRGHLDVHHVQKRSQGGSDFDLDQLVALCRGCHAQTDAPYDRGRLVVTPRGGGQFTLEVVRRAGKWGLPEPAGGAPGSPPLPRP
jgi:5-methylcytosine-specific restriction endonuclease McrA